jgi:hypothetical protein
MKDERPKRSLDADAIRQIRRRLREAEEGTTQEKVSARQQYAADVRTLLTAMDESGQAMAIEYINELETELRRYRRREEAQCVTAPLPRMKQSPLKFDAFDGKMAAAGKDC